MKKFVSITLIALVLNSCSVKTDDVQPIPQPRAEPYSQNVLAGPYEVYFDVRNEFNHWISNPISTTDTRIEYYISPAANTWFWVDRVQSGVTNCSPTQVQHEMFWIEDSRYPEGIRLVKPGSSIRAYHGLRGILIHNFKNLYGCYKVDLSFTLKK